VASALAILSLLAAGDSLPAPIAQAQAAVPRNVILILSDDHRYDFMGFHPNAPGWLETPGLDRLAAGGAHVENAFVTTALCSPSRASILTGQYAHRHGVVDNTSPIPPGTIFFPEALQKAGYATAYIGKWHMGEDSDSDRPRPGFDHWISFQGQGVYRDPILNVDGTRQQMRGYTTELLTDAAIAWLQTQSANRKRPFFLYLSHKAVHAEFVPLPRHEGRFAKVAIPYPATMADTPENYRERPAWVREQRNSWHGVDYMYHGQFDFDTFYRRYAETLLGLDEGVDRVLDAVQRAGLADSTLILYMGDNGFMLGEHGLIDKRNAYEESIRVPMLAYAPGLIAPGTKVNAVVRNIDVAPTILEMAGVRWDRPMDGRSVMPALQGEVVPGESEFLYEYYWEYAFPHTPTTFALRGDRYKFIFYHGLWDINELYDLQADPREQRNLINAAEHKPRVEQMRARLFDRLESTGGMQIPVRRGSWQAAERGPR
jgi:arylsulfatase A-like enzyme